MFEIERIKDDYNRIRDKYNRLVRDKENIEAK